MSSPDKTSKGERRAPLKERVFLFILEYVGPWIIRLMGLLCRYRVEGFDNLIDAEKGGKGAIITLWHGRMLLPVYYLRNRRICPLVSLHRDGEMIARIVQRLGYDARRGSPKEGGMEGFKAMLADLKAGRTVAIFPDGPTGPRHSVRDGVVHLARLSGAPIVPLSFSASPRWVAGSWDKFNVMKPFSKGVLLFGEPFTLPRRIGEEGIGIERERIRDALNRIEEEADRMMGYSDEVKI